MQLLIYILKRFLQTIPLLLIVSVIGFFLIRACPVDPLGELRMNPSISKQTLEAEKIRLGLDKPVVVQYGLWLKGFVKGDMGICTTGEKVFDKLKERIPNTLLLTITVIFFTWLVGIPLGIVAALNKGKPVDRMLTILSSVGMAIPSFFFALLMLIFAVRTGWFPTGGLTSYNFSSMSEFGKILDIAKHLVLPTLVLFTISLSGLQRQMRSNLLDVMESDYVKYARAKGLSENKVVFKHALRNAINPLVTLLGFEFASLLSGAALTEYVFLFLCHGGLMLGAVLVSAVILLIV